MGSSRERRGNPEIRTFLYRWRAAAKGAGDTTRHYATEAGRQSFLSCLDRQLQAHGVHRLKPENLGGRHAKLVVADWSEAIEKGQLSVSTVKNKLWHFRWLAKAVGKEGLIPKTNQVLGIPNRDYIPTQSKAQYLSPAVLDSIPDPYLRIALQVQQEFGLRREEALKCVWKRADRRYYLALEGSWCKSGRPRRVPILTPGQRAAIDAAKAMAKSTPKGSLVVDHYKGAKQRYDNVTQGVGLRNLHGLRHGYAQRRFEVLAGFPCPLAGGPTKSDMTPAQWATSESTRAQIATELGHGQPGKPRPSITVAYLGRRG